MSLLQQIQQEINREAIIDKRIDRIVKRFLKDPIYRKYRVVPTKPQADAILVLDRNDLSNFYVIFNKDTETLSPFENAPTIKLVFLKNKKTHDKRNTTLGDIKANHIPITHIKSRINQTPEIEEVQH